MSVEADVGLWKWLTGGIASAVGGLFGYHKYIEAKISRKADKSDVEAMRKGFQDEFTTHRGYFAKVFDQMRENEQRAQDRHERLMERLQDRP